MRLLLDTNIVIPIVENQTARLPQDIQTLLQDVRVDASTSLVALWEIAIKSRVGKLNLLVQPVDVGRMIRAASVSVLDIIEEHIFADIGPEPETRDPFDRLLLGVCAAEARKLVTLDKVLSVHPLAWQP